MSLYEIRKFTRQYMEEIAARDDLLGPVIDVGPMRDPTGDQGSVFARYPDTYVDARKLFTDRGLEYKTLDLYGADIVGDITDEDVLDKNSVGTLILFHVLEHVPDLFAVPSLVAKFLKPSGRCFIITPWYVDYHNPDPDCWRISPDGYEALFGYPLEIVQKGWAPDPERQSGSYAEIIRL